MEYEQKDGNLNLKRGKNCPKQAFRRRIHRDTPYVRIILDSSDLDIKFHLMAGHNDAQDSKTFSKAPFGGG